MQLIRINTCLDLQDVFNHVFTVCHVITPQGKPPKESIRDCIAKITR